MCRDDRERSLPLHAIVQADGEKRREDAQGEALEALAKGNVEIVAGSEKK
ncbi:hypothetical protein [uncultured Nostoc sp.]